MHISFGIIKEHAKQKASHVFLFIQHKPLLLLGQYVMS